MILVLGMLRLVAMPHAVITGTCDVSFHTSSQSTLKVSVSNAVGNERSESMREMCGCVSFSVSVRANAQVYASRSSWNVQELKETPHHSTLFLCPVLLFSPPLPYFSSYCSFFYLFTSFYVE